MTMTPDISGYGHVEISPEVAAILAEPEPRLKEATFTDTRINPERLRTRRKPKPVGFLNPAYEPGKIGERAIKRQKAKAGKWEGAPAMQVGLLLGMGAIWWGPEGMRSRPCRRRCRCCSGTNDAQSACRIEILKGDDPCEFCLGRKLVEVTTGATLCLGCGRSSRDGAIAKATPEELRAKAEKKPPTGRLNGGCGGKWVEPRRERRKRKRKRAKVG